MKKKWIAAIMTAAMVMTTLAGCGSSTGTATETDSTAAETQETEAADDSTAAGDVTLSIAFHYPEDFYEENIVPIVDEFKKLHPELKEVKFTTLSGANDEQQVTRLTGGQYEDVILVPSVLLASELPNYFAPLGDATEMASKYYYGDYMQYEGQSYGIPIGIVYEGLLYNKTVLDTYCDGVVPKTLDELYADLEKCKENGITGIYTNAGSVWTMRYWDNLAITMSGDDDYANKILTDQTPWAEGSALREADDILADFAKKGYVEADVVTADQWDSSLTSIGGGKTAFMFTGTWALSQAQEHAEELGLSADSIGFIPFPYKNDVSADNKLRMRIAQDLFMGVNKNSENLELAKEFCAFFCENMSLALGMNEIMVDGGENQPDLAFLQDLDYVETYTSPAKDPKIQEMAGTAEIDVYSFDGYLLDYVMLPVMNGGEPEYDKLNELWGKNFQ